MRRARPWAAGALVVAGVVALARAPLACAPATGPVAPVASTPRASDAAAANAAATEALAAGLRAVETPLADLGYSRVGSASGALGGAGAPDAGRGQAVFEAPAESSSDRCLRAAFVATERVHAELLVREVVRAGHEARGGLVGEAGPVCARKGEPIRLVVRGPVGTRVEVAWHGPTRPDDAAPR